MLKLRPVQIGDAVVFEQRDVSAFSDLLVEGTNVLAMRAINSVATSNDMLMLPELISREVEYGINPNANVYYTTDGTDPRGADGLPTRSAKVLVGGGTITVDQNTRIIARNFDDSYRGVEAEIVGTDWSGPVQYDLMTSARSLVISEINYHPGPLSVAEEAAGYSEDDFEFLELQNVSPVDAELLGFQLTDGVEFDFINSVVPFIPAGGRVVLVSNPAAFSLRYGTGLPVIGQFSGNLDNAGEDIDLVTGTGEVMFSVSYGDTDPWPVAADGLGATLELRSSNVSKAAQSKWYSWRSSTEMGGSPAAAGAGPLGVVINEILANPSGTDSDSIELHNTTTGPINVGGWFLSDSADDLFKYQIPAGTSIPSGGFVSFTQNQFDFGLSRER